MPAVTLYDPTTGRIKMKATLSDASHENLTQEQEPRIEGHFDAATYYVVDGAAQARPANPAKLVKTARQLRALPIPCSIEIDRDIYECNEETADLELGPGEYSIAVRAWPMVDANFTLRV